MNNHIHKAGGLLLKDKKLLLERHGGKDIYIIPGGKLEHGENAEQALIREFYEEFKLTIQESDLQLIGTFESPAVHSPTNIVSIETYLVTKWFGEITLNDGIEAIIWVNSLNIGDFKVSPITIKNVLPILLKMNLID